MAKLKKGKPVQNSKNIIKSQLRTLVWIVVVTTLLIGSINTMFLLWLDDRSPIASPLEWPIYIWISLGLFVLLLTILVVFTNSYSIQTQDLVYHASSEELSYLRSSYKRHKALQEMATTLRSTLSLDRVLDSALEVCTIGMQEAGIPERHIIAAILLYDGDLLVPVASRQMHRDGRVVLDDQGGAISVALKEAEPTVVDDPANDPSLLKFASFRRCQTVIVVPLRVKFQIYGVMLIGSEVKYKFDQDQHDLFLSVADLAVIALQNAQLYENLEEEKRRLIEAESDARKELARDLHDGPTQSVAAIAMRVNFVITLIDDNPDEATKELRRIEKLAKKTAKEIRGMLFTLRPLVLETQGLGAAIETVLERLTEETGIHMRLIGGDYGELLNPKAQGMVFYIVEEALGNAKKYSQARNIEVRFWQDQGLFVARVQDDGVGFDTDSVLGNYEERGSLGMVNMRERAETIDGSIKVDSAVGRGTSVTIVVPLNKQGQLAV